MSDRNPALTRGVQHPLSTSGSRSLCRTKGFDYMATEDLNVIQIPLGYTMIEITVQYLGFVMPFCSPSALASSCDPGANQALPA